MYVHLLMEADVTAFKDFAPDAHIYTGSVSEGEALLLPPGYIFCDIASYSGICGLRLAFSHRGCLDSLQVLKQDMTLFAATNGDTSQTEVFDFVIKGMRFVCVCGCAGSLMFQILVL